MIAGLNREENKHVEEVLIEHLSKELNLYPIKLFSYDCSYFHSKDPHNPQYYYVEIVDRLNSEEGRKGFNVSLEEFKESEKIIIKENREKKINNLIGC